MVIDKPQGVTSHDVVDMVRRATGVRDVGHAGTLDPMATGVLIVAIGPATKLIRFLETATKEYLAEVEFGIETKTDDVTGRVVSESKASQLGREDVEGVLEEFRGEIDQVPPMVSAVKVKGEPLYRAARRGEEVERKSRRVTILELEMVDFKVGDRPIAKLRVVCSAGTYVRSLARDLGKAVRTGAALRSLRRTRSGSFAIDRAASASELVTSEDVRAHLISLTEALAHLPKISVVDRAVKGIENGTPVKVGDIDSAEAARKGETVKIMEGRGLLLAIAELTVDLGKIENLGEDEVVAKPVRVLARRRKDCL